MLARQQRGRHHHRDLLAGHRRDEGGAQRHLGLAEADIAADQPVHRPAGLEILQHVGDGGELVLGLRVREAGAEFVVGAGRRPQASALRAIAARRRCGSVRRPCRGCGSSSAPCASARRRRRAGRARRSRLRSRSATAARCSRPAGTACRRRRSGFRGSRAARRRPRCAQPDIAADAVIHVHHEVARGEAGRLGDEIVRPLALPAGRTSRSPRMSCSVISATSAVSKPDSMPSTTSAISWRGSASASGHDATFFRFTSLCSASTCAMRSREPSLHSAISARLPDACRPWTCLATASNTLTFGVARSAAKLRPAGRRSRSHWRLPAPRTG